MYENEVLSYKYPCESIHTAGYKTLKSQYACCFCRPFLSTRLNYFVESVK